MRRIPNPFYAGVEIKDEEGFFGRKRLVNEVVSTLLCKNHRVVILNGQRSIGKTSLLYAIKRNEDLLQKFLPVIHNLQGDLGDPLSKLLALA
jgi:AAA+ ATPase superfamily predicted ATPase